MSTYRFPLSGKIGLVRGLDGYGLLRVISMRREEAKAKPRSYVLQDIKPLSEEEVRKLPVAHRCSA
ncbi:hypothetical protein DLM45_10130 [Hyphomicrobium methylovorum]|nr:hypothetical protein [Hyphomicrobium methylovorum]